MWDFLRQKTRGSPSIRPRDLLITELQEQNRLLRALLEAQGVLKPARRIPISDEPVRKRTAKDITVVTRETIGEDQEREAAAQRQRDSPG